MGMGGDETSAGEEAFDQALLNECNGDVTPTMLQPLTPVLTERIFLVQVWEACP
jgi:hypothetical protein